MAVIFPKWSNYLPLALAVVLGIGAVSASFGFWYWGSPEYIEVGYAPEQPVAFSHKLHTGDLGLDCRYCHNSVEESAHAAIPATSTCMNCHSIVKADSAKLSLIREAHAANEPVEWVNVHMLPDYAYFDHRVHVAAGVGCASCHGRIDQMEVVKQAEPLSMGWCLDCHRDPSDHLRPLKEVTNMTYDPVTAGYDAENDPHRSRMPTPPEGCSGCHR